MTDNYKHYRKAKKRRSASLDGFISGPSSGDPFKPPKTGRMRVDDFKRREGFHPTTRTSIGARSMGDFGRQPKRDKQGQIEIGAAKKPARTAVKPKHHKRRGIRRMAMKAMSMLMIFGLVSAGYLFGKAFLNAQQTFSGGAAALEENINRDGRINILLLGKGGAGHEGADLTDTLIIASIDPVNNEASLVSIPRDLYVSSGPYGGYTKINSVYANAKSQARIGGSSSQRAEEVGIQAIRSEISEVAGVPIHYHVMVDFKGFEKAVDIVGGVSINVPRNLAVYEVMHINGRTYVLNAPAGRQDFDGFRALAFSRTRNSLGSDFDRSERQRLMLLALKDKVLSLGTFANPLKVTQLLNTLGDHVRTSLSGIDELSRLYEISSGITADKVKSIGLADPPKPLVTTGNIGGLSVVIPTAGLDDYTAIHKFLQRELRDGFLKKENAKVAVFNAAGVAGLAARTADDLRAAGYNVGKVGNAASVGQAETVIVDLSGGQNKDTLAYLEKRFNLKVGDDLPDPSLPVGDADFVIILGQDETKRLDR